MTSFLWVCGMELNQGLRERRAGSLLAALPHPPTHPRTHTQPLAPCPPLSARAGSELVRRVIAAMVAEGCEEVALEAEVTNTGALRLYQRLGFIADKRLQRWVGRRAGGCAGRDTRS